jgi:hypothetical protein
MHPAPPTHYTHDVFLTYNHQDKEWVSEELRPELERAELKVLEQDLEYDARPNLLDQLESNVERTRRTLVVLSSTWREVHWKKLERLLKRTDDSAGRRRRLLPVKREPLQPPQWLSDLGYADLSRPDSRAGEMERLVRDLRAAVQEAPPAPMQTEEDARRLRAGLRAMDRLVSDLLGVEDVSEAFAAYQEQLEQTRSQIGRLTTYKQVHDLLHAVQIQCYNLLVQEIKRIGKERVGWEALRSIEQNLGNTAGKVAEIAEEYAVGAAEREQIARMAEELGEAHGVLKGAVAQQGLRQLEKARYALSGILSRGPSNISHSLTQMVKEVQLNRLGDGMDQVVDLCRAYPIDRLARQDVQAGGEALRRLDDLLRERVKKHDKWQCFEFELQRIESDLERNFYDNFRWSWEDVQKMARPLLDGGAASWAAELAQDAARVDTAVAQAPGGDEAGLVPKEVQQEVQQAFLSYRGLSLQRFYQVDIDLLKHCTKIARALGVG